MERRGELALITGASAGIGYYLAKECATHGFDLLIAADEPEVRQAAEDFRACGVDVQAVEADLSTSEGVDKLYAASKGLPVGVLVANAGRALGKEFLDPDLTDARRVVDPNIAGTICLIQKVGQDMRRRGTGRILITGSLAGFIPGTYQAVYNGTKAFLDSFSFALRAELEDSGVSVICLPPSVTHTEFFARADKKDNLADVAKIGFGAMMNGEGAVVGWKNKLQSAGANVTSAGMRANGTAKWRSPVPDNAPTRRW